MYRQISIAITERHVHAAAARFNRFGDTTGTAGHEVAYAWQSGHRPMQRHTTYGLDGAFPDHLQPALLRAYERVSASWQNFLWGCDKSGDPRSIPVEADRAQLNYASTHHSLTPSQKRPFISDLEESPSNNKRLRLIPDLSSVRGTMSTEAIAQPSSEESLVIGIEEDVNSFTFDYMSRPSPERDDEAAEPISDDAPLRIGPFVHVVELNLVICLDCKTAILARQVKAHLVDPLHRQHLTLKERRNISNQILEIPNILKDTDDLQHWKFPPPEAEPVPYLEPPLHNGLGCNSCRYIGRDLRRIREHYRQEHSDVLERGNPVDLSRLDQQSHLWRNDVTYQRMFRGGQKSSCLFHCEFIPERSTSSRPNCPYVGAELRRIREHLRVKHDWDMELKGGRRSAAMTDEERSNSPWRTGVCYQRLFSSGPGSELFEVARGLNLEQSRAQDDESQAALQRAIDAFQSKGKDIRSREAERIDEENDFTAPNPWLRRLGSAVHLKDFSGKKDFLRGLIAMEYEVDPDDPDKSDDAQLRFTHIAFDRLVNHAKAVITPDVVSWNALFEVNRKELTKERTKPFHFRFKPETQRRYALVVKQLLAYIVRCMSFEDKADRPPFKLSIRQQSAYDIMMEHADDLTDAWKENGGDPEAPEVVRLLDLLETAVLELYISVLDHFTKDTEYDSVLVSFLTVLSVRADGTWEGYEGFTPKLSAIMAISRLCIIKYAVDQRAKTIKQKMQQGQSQEEAEENSPSHFALISEMTRRFMVGGGEGWETTPTQFIIRLRNFGMAAQNNTAAHGSVSWDKGREELIYKGIRLSVLDVQAMMRLAVQQLETILYKDLLLFTEYSEQSPAELGLPGIPWDQLLDNAANETIGHSFIDTLFQRDGGASKGWVIKKVLQDSSLRSKWIKSIGDNGVEINLRMAYRYGLRIEKALELLAVLAHISGGFPLRAWELLVVRHRNTSNGGIRNILCDQGLSTIQHSCRGLHD
ncbi:hypothetical protein IWW34DRAFT_839405 [Fusarium oxysporum f. sp. albedinis]|nr:hypothetical protein IWW34DRAFT_839405 [Fusarium oxysporum f. sp. albedinis]